MGMAALPPCFVLLEGGNGKVGIAALPPCFWDKVVMAMPAWQQCHIGQEEKVWMARWAWLH